MPRHYAYQPSRELHVVVLGAGGVGKSCLTAQFVHNEWIESYDPTIEDSYRTQLQVDGRQVVLEILDTAGTEQFVAMRDLYMKTGQGFLLVFSITSSSSLSELAGLREEIIRIKDDENIPIVIVGNKADLEENRAVPRAKGFSISQRWGAPYYEASARTRNAAKGRRATSPRRWRRRVQVRRGRFAEEAPSSPKKGLTPMRDSVNVTNDV
ncbi:Ras family protein [Ilyonectria robusta]